MMSRCKPATRLLRALRWFSIELGSCQPCSSARTRASLYWSPMVVMHCEWFQNTQARNLSGQCLQAANCHQHCMGCGYVRDTCVSGSLKDGERKHFSPARSCFSTAEAVLQTLTVSSTHHVQRPCVQQEEGPMLSAEDPTCREPTVRVDLPVQHQALDALPRTLDLAFSHVAL